MHGRAGLNEPCPSRVASPAGSAALHSPGTSPASSCSRTPSRGTNIVRSHSNSVSSASSQTVELKLPAGSGDEGGEDSKSTSQDGSETNEEGGPALETKPLGVGNAKMVGAPTLKAPVAVMRKPKDAAVILESQAPRAVTAPLKPMVRFWPEWPHWQKRPKEMHQLRRTRQMTLNLLAHPHCLMLTTRTLKRSRNVSDASTPSFWTRIRHMA